MSKAVDSWLSPPLNFKLSSQEVHVWRVYIDTDDSITKKLQPLLSTDERLKAARFRFEKDSAKYIVTRGTLRIILGRYLDKKPEELKFSYNQYGKPALHSINTNKLISFNVSHSRGLALIAVAQNWDVGVDIEYVRTNVNYEEIAERFFSPAEKAVWRLLPTSVKQEAFFNCWTRKEAYIKAKGMGLSIPLNEFDVSFKPGEPAALLNTTWDEQEVNCWSLAEITLAPDYIAALAVEANNYQLKFWQFNGLCQKF